MVPIRLIRDKSELQGTCYIELLPGEYTGECWNDGSLFLAEEVFGLVEPVIERHEPRFDHYSFVAVGRPAWGRITADLERLAERAESATGVDDLRGDVRFIFTLTEAEFARSSRSTPRPSPALHASSPVGYGSACESMSASRSWACRMPGDPGSERSHFAFRARKAKCDRSDPHPC